MSYYSSSSTLLDSYCSNPSSRYDSLYSNTSYNNTYGASSAIDRYYSYLDDLTSSSSSRSSDSYGSSSSRYSSRYSSSVSDTSGYGGSGHSGSSRTSSYLNDYQPISSRYSNTSYGRSLISRAPAYDKYGKELSNYDRWRMSQGESVLDTTNNNNNTSTYGNSYLSNNNDTVKVTRSRRISRIDDHQTGSGSSHLSDPMTTTTTPTSSSSSLLNTTLNTSRELSVMPTVSNTYPEDLAALPSRFAQMNTRESRLARETGAVQKQRGKSVGPNLLSSSYSNTSSSFGSRGGSSSSSKLVHSFPLSVSSKVRKNLNLNFPP